MFASFPTQITAEISSQLASQLELWVSLNNRLLESIDKYVNLNMQAAKQSLVDASAASPQLRSRDNAPGSGWVNPSHVGPNGNVLRYGYQAADIAWCLYAELAKLAQVRLEETDRRMTESLDDGEKNALNGTGRMGSIVMQIPGKSSSASPTTMTREQK